MHSLTVSVSICNGLSAEKNAPYQTVIGHEAPYNRSTNMLNVSLYKKYATCGAVHSAHFFFFFLAESAIKSTIASTLHLNVSCRIFRNSAQALKFSTDPYYLARQMWAHSDSSFCALLRSGPSLKFESMVPGA